MTTFLLALLLFLPAITSWRVASFLLPESAPPRRWFAAWCLYPMIVGATMVLLHPFGAINPPGVLVGAVVLCGLSFVLRPPAVTGLQSPGGAPLSPFVPVGIALLGAAIVYHVLKLFLFGPLFFSDDFAYHGQTVTGWLRAESLNHPLIPVGAYYPYNPHLLAGYLSVPTHDPRWVWMGSLYWVGLGIGGMLSLGRQAPAAARPLFLLAAALFAVSPWVIWMAALFCSSDMAGGAALFAAFAFFRPREGLSRRERISHLFLFALLAGFAIGTKPTFVVPAAIGLTGALAGFLVEEGHPLRRWWKVMWKPGALVLALGTFLTGSFWYLRNWITTGNPLFPFRLDPFQGPVRGRHLEGTHITDFIRETPFSGEMWLEIFRSLLDWPLPSGLAALAGLVAGIWVAGLAAWRMVRERTPAGIGDPFSWLAVSAVAMLLFHATSPFSGSTLGGEEMVIYNRYIIFVYLAGLALAARWFGPRGGSVAFGAAVLLCLWSWPFDGLGWASLALGAALAPLLLLRGVWRRIPLPVLAAGAAPLLFGALFLRQALVPGPYMTVEIEDDAHEPFIGTIAAIDQLPPGSRIAQLTSRIWETWHLYGSSFQHEALLTDQNGNRLDPIHVAFREDRIGGAEGQSRFGIQELFHYNQPDRVASNLLGAGAEYVLVTQYSFGPPEWPPQRGDFRAAGIYELIWTNGHSEIYAAPGVANPFEGRELSGDDAPG